MNKDFEQWLKSQKYNCCYNGRWSFFGFNWKDMELKINGQYMKWRIEV
jgi:hypothetical protein